MDQSSSSATSRTLQTSSTKTTCFDEGGGIRYICFVPNTEVSYIQQGQEHSVQKQRGRGKGVMTAEDIVIRYTMDLETNSWHSTEIEDDTHSKPVQMPQKSSPTDPAFPTTDARSSP